jgi:hypothetical protein
MFDPGASIWHLPSHTIRIKKHISRRIMMLSSVLRTLRTHFPMLRTRFPMLRAPPSSPDIVYMLRAMLRTCGEHVASLWWACCDHHLNIKCEVDRQLGGRLIFPPSDAWSIIEKSIAQQPIKAVTFHSLAVCTFIFHFAEMLLLRKIF